MTGSVSSQSSADFGDVRARVDQEFPLVIEQLSELVRIPSISWEAFDRAHVQASAERIAELTRETDFFDTVEIHSAATSDGYVGQPAVLAHRPARAGYPTVVLYSHHDVQPVGDETLWQTPPFEPTVRDGRLYGRGSSDDKAGVVTHLAVARMLTERYGADFPLGVTMFIEGEEEAGSRSFEQFLDDHASVLHGDAIVVCDSNNVNVSTPALTTALRGNITFKLTIRTLEHANHSGEFGGAVPDAVMAFVRLIDTCWNVDGSVAVAGLTTANLPDFEYSEQQLRDESGLIGEPIGRGSLMSRRWAQPTVTITGMDLPSVAEASNTLIPVTSARISVRVAPGQPAAEAWEAVRAHLEAQPLWGAELSFSELDLGEAFLVNTAGPHVERMRTALREGWNAEPAEIGIGGSIPFIALLAARFPQAEILVTAVGDPLSQPHSPNESQHLGALRNAVESELRYLLAVAAAE
ncbi:MAG: dipeptidase [Microbacteriaceae bacterium]